MDSSFVYKGKSIDVKTVGRELGVRYVLEGSVRKAGNRVRVMGRGGEATASARHLLDLQPGFTIASLVSRNFTSAQRLAKLAEALRQAGLPET